MVAALAAMDVSASAGGATATRRVCAVGTNIPPPPRSQCLSNNPRVGWPWPALNQQPRSPRRVLGFALLASALAVGAAAQTDDHGDHRASATHVELPSETAGEINPASDEDWVSASRSPPAGRFHRRPAALHQTALPQTTGVPT